MYIDFCVSLANLYDLLVIGAESLTFFKLLGHHNIKQRTEPVSTSFSVSQVAVQRGTTITVLGSVGSFFIIILLVEQLRMNHMK